MNIKEYEENIKISGNNYELNRTSPSDVNFAIKVCNLVRDYIGMTETTSCTEDERKQLISTMIMVPYSYGFWKNHE